LETPVSSGTLVLQNKFGDEGVFNGVDWWLSDFSGTSFYFESRNMEIGDRVTDIP
jgi:hypothetical protein